MSDKKVPPPEDPDPPEWANQSRAKNEEKEWSNEDQLRGAKHKNDMLWLSCYGWLVVAATIFFTLLFMASLGAWSWHYLAPVGMTWLTPDQLSKIQSVVFSGSLGAIVTSIMRKQMEK
jgi:hypothetical protein